MWTGLAELGTTWPRVVPVALVRMFPAVSRPALKYAHPQVDVAAAVSAPHAMRLAAVAMLWSVEDVPTCVHSRSCRGPWLMAPPE